MRTFALTLLSCVMLGLAAGPARAEVKPPDKEEHPGEVALVQGTDRYIYLHFPSNMRLYQYDKDMPGKSTCTDKDGCAGVWPPLIAPADEKPMGDWTIITRDDTLRQWVYKGHPVYLKFHDSPDTPTGDGYNGVWHFLQP